jgi:hypothetical protein
MGEVKIKVIEGKCGAGGAHAMKFRVSVGVFADAFVRGSKSFEEGIPGIIGRFLAVDVLNRLNRESTGFLSAFIATHPVSHHGESSLPLKLVVSFRLPVGGRVLIVGTLAADIRQAGHLNSWPNFHYASLEGIYNRLFAALRGISTNFSKLLHPTPRTELGRHNPKDSGGMLNYIT